MYKEITQQAKTAVCELIEAANLQNGDLLVIGCSTSEVGGEKIGKGSSIEIAHALHEGIAPILVEKGIYLAAQCCEHLNRAVIIEAEAAEKFGYEPVNVVPQPKAGGSFATTVYERMKAPVAVEGVRAKAGLDIGGTLIGMQLKCVAVPVRLSLDMIGKARILCARTRPKFVGGVRAHYNEDLL
ncbi:MAG: TIGR01440 family protein [Ruminococcaceae bacterium]|nr:TIGR01440 family protein [Oscillospiraceae bacterium]